MGKLQQAMYGNDPLDPRRLQRENRSQLFADILRNTAGLPENALMMGSGLADMAGTGLGTLAGMAKQKLSGDNVDLDAATDTLQEGRFTFEPRSTGGKELTRGIGTVSEPLEQGMQWAGQKTTDVTGSPALGAAVYTGLNMFDPEMLAPAAAKVAALRGATRVARSVSTDPVQRKGAIGTNQSGAWSHGDIADTEGNFEFRSPTMDAFDRLKPQEQGRVSGQQLAKALQREGGKKEELAWLGLDPVAQSKDLVQASDVRQVAEENVPQYSFHTMRGGELDDDAISEAVSERVSSDDDLEYPIVLYRGSGRHREEIGTYGTMAEVREAKKEYLNDLQENEITHYLENIEDHLEPEELEGMSERQKQEWAETMAEDSVDNVRSELDTDRDYDSDPTNYDEIYEFWDNEVRSNPEQYGVEGGKPDYGEFTVGGTGESDPHSNYSVSAARLRREERFGKGTPGSIRGFHKHSDMPEMLRPDLPDDKFSSKAFEIEALRRNARDVDPDANLFTADASESHYKDLGENQQFFVRETDQPAPDWGSTPTGVGAVRGHNLKDESGKLMSSDVSSSRPVRNVEEWQSDNLQHGRKVGFADPKTIAKARIEHGTEGERISAYQEQALNEVPTALNMEAMKPIRDRLMAEVEQLKAEDREHELSMDATRLLGAEERYNNMRNSLARGEQVDMGLRIAATRNLVRAYQLAADAGEEAGGAMAVQLMNGLDRLPHMAAPPEQTMMPPFPMKETRQYSQFALADALRRAVQEGQQYLAWTPPDVHTKRWGTDTFQYSTDPENPRFIRWVSDDTSRSNNNKTGMENLQDRADKLNDDANAATLNLDDPNLDARLLEIVRNNLSHGMHAYPNPEAQMKKRAKSLRAELEKLSAGAAPGHRVAKHYSPRAEGYELAYGPAAEDLAAVLRRAGVEMPEVRDIMQDGIKLKGFEITPEIARAAKKGFHYPY